MKKILTKPGFEVIFSLALITIMALPPLVLAQTQKSIEIKIVNGDTTINGRDIKKLNAAERKDALAAMNDAPVPPPPPPAPGNNETYTLNKNKSGNTVIIEKQIVTDNNGHMLADGEPSRKRMRLKRIATDSTYSTSPHGMPMPLNLRFNRNMVNRAGSRNTQSFSYANTDNDGITTNVNYSVNNVPEDKFKALTGADKESLDISNLNLGYDFSTAKTVLTLNLPAGASEIKLTDGNGSTIWTDKTTATSFTKKFALPVNGVYYLQAKQGSKVALKKIVKK